MKKFLFSVLLLISFSAIAQKSTTGRDSIRYYQREVSRIGRNYQDSMRNDSAFVRNNQNLERLKRKSDNYAAFTLYTTMSSSDFSKINSDNASSNFGPINDNVFGIGYGFSSKKNRRIFDLNVATIGIGRKTKKNDQSIHTSFTSFFEFVWGYDFIKSNKISIYPFAGLGFRSSGLRYKGSGSVNPNFTNVSNIVQNESSVNEATSELGYQAGLGLEFSVTKADNLGGVIVFIKAGTNNPFKRKAFEFQSIKYDPKLKYGQFFITAGFKFFGR